MLAATGATQVAQPDGVWIGAKGTPTNVTADGPALKGATNVILPARDHREASFHAEAFVPTFEFITGGRPTAVDIAAEPSPLLDGLVIGLGPGGPTNRPLADATVEVYAVDAAGARIGDAKHRRQTGPDGRWGPFRAEAGAAYESGPIRERVLGRAWPAADNRIVILELTN